MEINQRIIYLLKKKSLTQKDLCIHTKIPQSTLNNWLKLNRSIPSEHIIPICEFFSISPTYLLTGIENESNIDEKNIKKISPYNDVIIESSEEYELIKNFRKLNESDKFRVLGIIEDKAINSTKTGKSSHSQNVEFSTEISS